MLQSDQEELFLKALEDSSKNEVWEIKVKGHITPGNKALASAKYLLNSFEYIDEEQKRLFLESINNSLVWPAVSSLTGSLGNSKREQAWSALHKKLMDPTFFEEFVALFPLSEAPPILLFNHLIFELLYLTIQRCSSAVSKEPIQLDLKLSDREEQVLRYVAGYIPFSLKRIYSRIQGNNAKTVLQVLSHWRAPSENGERAQPYSFLDYTKRWSEEVNRGGLFLVNDDFYIFIRRLENVARTVFNRNLIDEYRGEDLRDLVAQKMLKSKLIIEAWDKLTRNIDNRSLVQVLLKLIVNKWVNLRARAFAEAWVDIMKAQFKDRISKKAEPSMRKCLS